MTNPDRLVPELPLDHLDQLWFQVTGTLCNLTCHHCFISCTPTNKSFGMLSYEAIAERLEEAATLGVKEYYFTGGEPFLHPRIVDILCLTLQYGPATVLTNGTVLKPDWITRLRRAEDQSRYGLEFRVSIDGFSPETNDPIRGIGTFERATRGIQQLVHGGFLPIITAARTWPIEQDGEMLRGFIQSMQSLGYAHPRIKLLPTLQIGAEERRTRGYLPDERITLEMMQGFDASHFLCHHARIVTDRGVHVCPILIETPDSVLGQTLVESQRPFSLQHGACFTCYQYGAICSNAGAFGKMTLAPK
jgi:molybdenum cofactor biosynthesis enzyme MoaA